MDQIPAFMKSIAIVQPGGPDVLAIREIETPHPDDNEILIKVRAAGVNRPDILQREGLYPAPKGASDILGLEVSGIVQAVGRSVSRFNKGDAVCALAPGGGYAAYCVVNETNALPKPERLSFEQAACVPETFFTVWYNVFQRGGLQADETLLVHGGASGIGTTAIQLGKAFDAVVITTVGTEKKCQRCRELGADLAINYKSCDFVKAVKDFTKKRGADLILDMVGGDYIERNYVAAAPGGRIAQIAFLNGATSKVNFTRLMLKRLTHTGSTLRTQPVSVKANIAQALFEKVWPLFEAGTITPVLDTTFALENAADAHRHMERSAHFGKIALKL